MGTGLMRAIGEKVFISVDVESSGGAPGKYSMLSLGACVVGNTKEQFYVELKPLNKNFEPEALKVSGFTMGELEKTGVESKTAMRMFKEWTTKVSKGKDVVFASWGTFDWLFVKWYLSNFGDKDLLGHTSLDIKSYSMGVFRIRWDETKGSEIGARVGLKIKHPHNALKDAIEQADILEACMKINAGKVDLLTNAFKERSDTKRRIVKTC